MTRDTFGVVVQGNPLVHVGRGCGLRLQICNATTGVDGVVVLLKMGCGALASVGTDVLMMYSGL